MYSYWRTSPSLHKLYNIQLQHFRAKFFYSNSLSPDFKAAKLVALENKIELPRAAMSHSEFVVLYKLLQLVNFRLSLIGNTSAAVV